ncbi:MAG: TRAP transporter large permease subunit [Spirochaetes bacterium]|nr:TRAP transporter large permease subunit [Spirochaetota bacterium]
MITVIVILTLVLMLIGFPLFAGAGILAAFLFFFLTDVPLQAMITQINMMITVPLLAVFPVFTFMGYILNYGRSSQRLANLANSLLSWLPGGLAISAVLVYSFFSAITGGSAVSIMALGGLYFAALKKSEYPEKFTLGICTVMGGGGIMFPPSLPIFIMGFTASISADLLFTSALIPGIVTILLFVVYCSVSARRYKIPRSDFSFKRAWAAIKDVILEVPVVVILIGGIFLGWMTVNEVAILSLIYIIFAECIVRREVSAKNLYSAAIDSMVLTGAIFAIMASALTINNFLIDYEIPQKALIIFQQYFGQQWQFMLVMNLILLVTGCLMDVFSAILVMVPLLMPIAIQYGVDPVHFAMIFIWNLEIGFSTPPVGFNLFVGSFRFKKNMDELYRAAVPGIICQLVGLMLITYIPWLTNWLPSLVNLKKSIAL